jgi:tRNA uridine 5-carbamoylmethylation protein Kti12
MLLLLCGPPAVGKTTIASRLRERLAETGREVALLRSDQFNRQTYEQMYERVTADSETDWILDGTFYKQKWRDRFRGIGNVTLAYITADLETCIERNRHRDDPIDEQGVHVIYHEFDEPEADIVLDTDVLAPDEAVEQLRDEIEEDCQS